MSGPGNVEGKTDRQLVDDANELARHFYKSFGYVTHDDYKFHEATHPQERGCWNLAVIAYEFLTDTDLENALAGIEEEEQDETEESRVNACNDCRPDWDEEASKGLSAAEVRRRWPRYHGECKSCGFKGIRYASTMQYIRGDY